MTTVLVGDALQQLRRLPDESVQMCVTSPPYWGLRAYGTNPQIWGGDPRCKHFWGPAARTPWANHVPGPNGGRKNGAHSRQQEKWTGPFCVACGAWRGELGLEPTPELFVAHIVEVFREVRRVLKNDGTCWINLGDSYSAKSTHAAGNKNASKAGIHGHGGESARALRGKLRTFDDGLKPKDLVGMPWRVAFALQADGWYLRSDIVWHKTNPMPESVTDRPTKSHEYLFLLAKSQKYFYDAKAIKEKASPNTHDRTRKLRSAEGQKSFPTAQRNGMRPAGVGPKGAAAGSGIRYNDSFSAAVTQALPFRNKRTVWTVPTKPFKGSHFATFPPKLVEPCILAGSRPGDVVLDPFGGAFTTALVAEQLGRNALMIELNPEYVEMGAARLQAAHPLKKAAA